MKQSTQMRRIARAVAGIVITTSMLSGCSLLPHQDTPPDEKTWSFCSLILVAFAASMWERLNFARGFELRYPRARCITRALEPCYA